MTLASSAFPFYNVKTQTNNWNQMTEKKFDVIIIGGSYAGLAAGMALGRSLKKTLIIDSGQPCNRQTPHSHNFLTQDGKTPMEIATLAKEQVRRYNSVSFLNGTAVKGKRINDGFEIETDSGDVFSATKLIFTTGVRDIMPTIHGFSECWGISALHCPYCHGYEVRNQPTGILGNGEYAFEFSQLISNWTSDLTLFTNGPCTLSSDQREKLATHNIAIIEKPVATLHHENGYVRKIMFEDGDAFPITAIYTRCAFEQHCAIPQSLGCELSDDGFISVNQFHATTIPGVYACGDNTTRMRSVANAVGTGTAVGAIVNRELVFEKF